MYKPCESFLIVLVLALLGWVPGIIGAMVICTWMKGRSSS